MIDKTFWGQGLGSEAAQGILDYAVEQLRLTRLICLIDHDNHCLLYTSDAADERSSVDLGGRRIIKKKKKEEEHDRSTNNKDTHHNK